MPKRKSKGNSPSRTGTNLGRVGTAKAEANVDQALRLLDAVGFPELGSPLLCRRRARVLLAVCTITPTTPWAEATADGDGRDYAPSQKGIVRYVNKHYGERIAEGSYDDVKRKHLRHLEAARLVFAAVNRPGSAVNDGTRGYGLNPAAADVVRRFGTEGWQEIVDRFVAVHGTLKATYSRERTMTLVPVLLPDGAEVMLADTAHNALQIAVVREFLPRFAPGADLLYLGDSDRKEIALKRDRLDDLRFFEIDHDTMPDVVGFDAGRNWLFLVEAVNSANPISPQRHRKYEQMTADCTAGIVYVSAFKNHKAFAKYAADISWETEVWIADHPTHMIHYNGDRFLGPHRRR